MTQPRSPRDGLLRVAIPGFGGGIRGGKFQPGYYRYGTNFDGRFGFGMAGLREDTDLTGIAATFRVIKILKHADTNVAIATDGTTTRVYRKETTWVSKVDQVDGGASNENITGVATDAISFKSILAIALGASVAYVFTTATTATGRTWDFTTSTKSGSNSKYANYFHQQVNGLLAPRVTYVRNPNEVYYTEDLTNTDATGSTPSYIGDNASAQQYFNSITEDTTGKLLLGMRRALYSLDGDGKVEKLTPDYADPALDAGGQSDRLNFENPQHVNDRIYFPIRGYDILEYYYGRLNDRIAPRHIDPEIPVLDLPINAMVAAGGWLVLAIGSANTSSIRNVTYASGTTSRHGNSFNVISELYVGRRQVGPDGQETFAWHGNILRSYAMLRYMWFDPSDSYIYMASGASESANNQMRRSLFYTENPLHRGSATALPLYTNECAVELGGIDFGVPFDYKEAEHISLDTQGLSSTISMEVEYGILPGYIGASNNYVSNFVTFSDDALAEIGEDFPPETRFRRIHLRFLLGNTSTAWSILREVELIARLLPREREARATR